VIGLVLAGLVVAALGVSDSGGGDAPPSVTERPEVRREAKRVGQSARGRPIRAVFAQGQKDGPLVLVVGCIHGNEPGGLEIAEKLGGVAPPAGELVVVPNLNPDGLALDTRTNARGVDLNRNFASGWRPSGAPGDPEHSGPRPFSEPESRLARRLIRRLRPDVTIWFHQQVEPPLVRAWGSSVPAARAYARLAGSAFDRLSWLPGSAPNWQNHRFPGTSSFVVELPWGELSPPNAARHAQTLLELGAELKRGDA
jgi:murein peptide amidase A